MKTIGLIALSGKINKEKLLSSKDYFEKNGYCVKLSSNIFDDNRYLAGSDETKINELHKFFQDEKINIIMAARGGYGAIRLINYIDYNLLAKTPKIFCGYSDVTALLLMIYKKTGMITYHGPMATSDFAEEISEFTKDNFLKAINGEKLVFDGNKIYKQGEAKGIIWGGNLSTIVSLCGLDFIPNKDFIFFTEDLNEPVYKIDKMFQQLLNLKEFKKYCKGIVLGDFLYVDNENYLDEYFQELATRLSIPVISGFPITHAKDKITIPIGKIAYLADNKLVIN